jgi:hypothetical protein
MSCRRGHQLKARREHLRQAMPCLWFGQDPQPHLPAIPKIRPPQKNVRPHEERDDRMCPAHAISMTHARLPEQVWSSFRWYLTDPAIPWRALLLLVPSLSCLSWQRRIDIKNRTHCYLRVPECHRSASFFICSACSALSVVLGPKVPIPYLRSSPGP